MRGHGGSPRPEDRDDPKLSFKVVKSLLPYLAEFPMRVFVAMALLVAAKLASVALPMLMKFLVDALDSAKQSPEMTLAIVPIALLLAYGGLRFANILFGELRDVVFGRVTERAMRRAALNVFKHLHALDLSFHLSRRTGGLSRDIERGVSGIRFLLRFMLFNILPTLLEIALVAAILFKEYGAEYAWIILVAVVLYIFFSVWVTEWRTRYVREANRLDSHANTRAIDSLLNFETVKLFGNENHEANHYDASLEKWEVAQQQTRVSLAALNLGQAIIVSGSVTLMMYLAAKGVAAGEMTIGDFVAVNAYMIQLFVPLNFLGFVYREIRRALTDMQHMFGLLDRSPQISDSSDAKEMHFQRPSLTFKNIGFHYNENRQILNDVSFHVESGATVAVVGSSGAGKSTLARLLFRFYDATSGEIQLNGHGSKQFTLQSLRAHFGVVPQDTVLFNETLRYNIAYGKPDASDAEIEHAAKLAHLDDFIKRLPDGMETQVGERGLKLSGGEKQRVAIARALLRDPQVLIFDEATSSLDSVAERAIMGAIREASAARTTLMIAHRLSTVVHAHQILVLEHGNIVESGTHAQLLAKRGVYEKLWNLQQEEREAV